MNTVLKTKRGWQQFSTVHSTCKYGKIKSEFSYSSLHKYLSLNFYSKNKKFGDCKSNVDVKSLN